MNNLEKYNLKDERLQEVIESLENDFFNLLDKEYFDPTTQDKFTFRAILKDIDGNPHPKLSVVRRIIEVMKSLPRDFQNAYNEVKASLRLFEETLEELGIDFKESLDKIESLNTENQNLSEALEEANKEIESYQRILNVVEHREEIVKLKTMNEFYKENKGNNPEVIIDTDEEKEKSARDYIKK